MRMTKHWLWLLPVLLALKLVKSTEAGTGSSSACETLKGRISDDELKVDENVLWLLNNSLQRILECVPASTRVIVHIPKYQIQEKLIISRPVTITSIDGRMLLGCDGMEIRSNDVSLGGLKILECVTRNIMGLIHVESAHDVLFWNIDCSHNTNKAGGPACMSVIDSTAELHNVVGTDNVSSRKGGLLLTVNSNLVLYSCTFMRNTAKFGGAAAVQRVSGVVEGSTISFNVAKFSGGGISGQDMDLRMDDSVILSNMAHIGGGIYGVAGSMYLNNANISSNDAFESGGGIYGKDLTVRVEMSVISFNSADFGGGICGRGGRVLVEESEISFNIGKKDGGGIFGKEGDIYVQNSKIVSNVAEFGGGVWGWNGDLHVEKSEISLNVGKHDGGGIYGKRGSVHLESTKISSNTAEVGGGVWELDVDLHVEKSIISSNDASQKGGGIYAEQCSIAVVSSHFDSNAARMEGGGLCSIGAMSESFENATISNNSAETGGGAYVYGGQELILKQSWFHNNTAGVNGGAMSVLDAREFEVHGSRFTRNKAGNVRDEDDAKVPNSSGGAISVKGESTRTYSIFQSSLSGNTAAMGGAISVENFLDLELVECMLQNNSAIFGGALSSQNIGSMKDRGGAYSNYNAYRDGGAISLIGLELRNTHDIRYTLVESDYRIHFDNSKFIRNEAKLEGGAINIAGHSFVCANCKIESNKAGESGGGLIVKSFALTLLVDTQISSCTSPRGAGVSIEDAKVHGRRLHLASNKASEVGGAIAAKLTSAFASEEDLLVCDSCFVENNKAKRAGIIHVDIKTRTSSDRLEVPHVYFDFSSFYNNEVEDGFGPLMMFSTFYGTKMCCGQGECQQANNIQNLTCLDQNIKKQTLLGTFVKDVRVSPEKISDYSSTKEIGNITVTLIDEFGNLASVNASLTVKADVEISGKLTAGVEITRESVVNGLVLRATPGWYNITLEIESQEGELHFVRKLITVEVRRCTIGEHAKDGNRICDPCLGESYNIGSNMTCHKCKEHALCDGKTIVPMNGYWHSNSHSDTLYKCIDKSACSYDNRIERLREEATANFPAEVVWDGNYTLCSEGHRGILCGSCEEEYGRSTGNCKKCPKKGKIGHFWNYVLVAASLGLLCLMVALSVQSTNSYSSGTLERGALERSQAGALGGAGTREDLSDTDSSDGSKIHPGDILKILINFFQTNAMAASAGGEKQGSIAKAKGIFRWVSGMTSESAYFSMTCVFKNNNRFILASILTICLPFIVWLTFVGYSPTRLIFKGVTRQQFNTFCFVSGVAIIDISYMGWTKMMARIWTCQDLHSKTYWTEDTNIVCSAKPHRILFYIAALPILVVLTLGLPIFVGSKLTLSRDKLHTDRLVSRYGYFYQSYGSKFASWDAMIHVRKAAIAVISALSNGNFSYTVGSALSTGVMIAAGALQNVFAPFKEDKLNAMEAFSLYTSSFIFALRSMLYSIEGDAHAETWLAVFMIGVPVAFVAYMGFEYLNAWNNHLQGWLRNQQEYANSHEGVVPYIRTWIHVISSQLKLKVYTDADSDGDADADGDHMMQSVTSVKIKPGGFTGTKEAIRQGDKRKPFLGAGGVEPQFGPINC